MKALFILMGALFLAGCASYRQGPTLTVDQATVMATQLANDKTFAFFHVRPFSDGQLAKIKGDRWYWSDLCGYGSGDIHADVVLAADGSTNMVEVQLLDSRSPVTSRQLR
jgi:hypothetical protein